MKKVNDPWPRGVGANGLLRCCKHNEPAIMLLAYAVTMRRESLFQPRKTLVCVSSHQQALSMNMSMGICRKGALNILASFGDDKMNEFYFLLQSTKHLHVGPNISWFPSVRFINRTHPNFRALQLDRLHALAGINYKKVIVSYRSRYLSTS